MDDIEVIKGDALEEMAQFPDGGFAAIVTDPAYWTLDKYRAMGTTTRLGGGSKRDSDSDKFFETIDQDYLVKCIMEFDRLLPKNGHAWIMCDHLTQVYILGFVREAGRRKDGGTDFIYSKLYPVRKLTQDGKSTKPGMGYHGRSVTEYVVLLEKGRRKFSDDQWDDYFDVPWVGAKESRPFTPDGKPYPTAKPVSLYKRLIELSTKPGDRILDPFAGSGAAGEAARLSGRFATLIDKSQRSVQTIMNRLHQPQHNTFDFSEESTMTQDASQLLRPKGFLLDSEQMQEYATLQFDNAGERQTLTVPTFDLVADAAAYAQSHIGVLYTWKSEGIHNWLVIGIADTVDYFCCVFLPHSVGDYLDLDDDEETEIESEDKETLLAPATLTVPMSYRLYLPESDDITETGYFDHAGVVALLRKYKGNPEAIQFIADMME